VAQPVAVSVEVASLTPGQTLAQAAAVLAPEKSPCLRVHTWQKQNDPAVSFEAKGRFVRAPNHCARLEITVHAGPKPTNIVVVSDGVALARACSVGGRSPQVSTRPLTATGQKPLSSQEANSALRAHGCGGPYCLLKDLQRALDNLQAAPGVWKDKRVIRLTGSVKEAHGAADDPFAAWPRFCHVYLDAQTLWPHRVEWWAATAPREPGSLFLEVEFRDPDTSPLSEADCIREFTYEPD
jgi:hypothetical protein